MVKNVELTTSVKNITFKSETFHHTQLASVDESTMSAGWRDFDECYSMVNMVKECGKLIGRPGSDVNNEEFMDGKNLSSKSETLHDTQSACVDECTESAGQIDGWSMLNTSTECENKLSGFGKLIGHYLHPKPVLSVLFLNRHFLMWFLQLRMLKSDSTQFNTATSTATWELSGKQVTEESLLNHPHQRGSLSVIDMSKDLYKTHSFTAEVSLKAISVTQIICTSTHMSPLTFQSTLPNFAQPLQLWSCLIVDY
uniref:Uncharacterized protein n=1 Tax=Kalanchoe fedtschenkoi TaxID=63787 RepID=A0A7N1A431_KALFE